MTDLTVLVSPTPFIPSSNAFLFRRSTSHLPYRAVMVTLQSPDDHDFSTGPQPGEVPAEDVADQSEPKFSNPESSPSRRASTPIQFEPSSLLSPPVNTWKAPRSKPRHRPNRSQSAPPERRNFTRPTQTPSDERHAPLSDSILSAPPTAAAIRTTKKSFGGFTASTRGGQLLPPPPPLLRPTTFWRKTRRSGVTGASYSPSSHLIRRSTYIAAGLKFDAPIHDLSALCVESRVGFIVVPPDHSLNII